MLERARFHAQQLAHDAVEPEHLLLGLLEDPVIAVLLTGHAATTDRIRSRLIPILVVGTRDTEPEPPPMAGRLNETLAFADEERVGFGHEELSSLHLLLGLIREGDGVSGRVLAEFGVMLEPMRLRVLECLAALYP